MIEPPAVGSARGGVILVLCAAAIFSFKGVLAKLIYAEGVGVPALLALRFAMSVPLTWAIAFAIGMTRRPPTGRELAAVVLGGALGYGAAPIADFIALDLIAVSIERVVLRPPPGEVRARARPPPRARLLGEAGRDRIVLHVAHRRHQVRVVHRVAAEAALEQVAAPALPEVDEAGVAAVRLAERAPQRAGRGRHQDQVDVIVHETPGEASHAFAPATLGHEVEIGGAVLVAEEDGQPAIAALGDVVRDVRDDDAG